MSKQVVMWIMLIVCIIWCGMPVQAQTHYEDGFALYEPDVLPAAAEDAVPSGELPVTVRAKAAVLMDQTSGKVLLEMHSRDKVYPASVTKIMSLLLVAEAIDNGSLHLDDMVTASTNASSKGGSQIWLKEGETMSVRDLLKATAVYSANDACTALGEQIAGGSEAFVEMMNTRAKELGMADTHFVNCTGLDDDTTEHLTSAYDVAIMSRELLRHEWITEYTTIWMDSVRNGATELVNTNKLVRFYEGTTGLKTGTTNKAGCCVSASARRGETHMIAVVMGSGNSSDRFEGAKALLNWGFANYETITPEIDMTTLTRVRVLRGVEKDVVPQMPQTLSVLIPKGRREDITQQIDLQLDVQAPVEKGQKLGSVTIKFGEETLGEYALTAPRQIDALTVPIVFRRLIGVFSQ